MLSPFIVGGQRKVLEILGMGQYRLGSAKRVSITIQNVPQVSSVTQIISDSI
jgi:hypothetical protein